MSGPPDARGGGEAGIELRVEGVEAGSMPAPQGAQGQQGTSRLLARSTDVGATDRRRRYRISSSIRGWPARYFSCTAL